MTSDFTSALSTAAPKGGVRTLHIVAGDQLDVDAPALEGLDRNQDAVLMMEVEDESTHVPSHRQRTVLFLSAMRHFALDLVQRGYRVRYVRMDDPHNTQAFDTEIARAIDILAPESLSVTQPGEWRVQELMESVVKDHGLNLKIRDDDHFYCRPEEFANWAKDRKSLVMEYFYRGMRKRHNVLMDRNGKPEGGEWNHDKSNRQPPSASMPGLRNPPRFKPDRITEEVIAMVRRRLPDLPGRLDDFGWPVTRKDAQAVLDHFIEYRLPDFGPWQDAMVTGEPWMFHSLLSPLLNLKLLNPREVIAHAVAEYKKGGVRISSVEGFVRQILGWREFIRGVYRYEGADYVDRNEFGQTGKLPEFYWTGDTGMNCLRESLRHVIDHGYGHHIQRLMVTGNFALISGIHPRVISDWYLGMYVDAVDWVTLPNTLGMVMHADGGVVGTKPYAAGGNYINRMSDYCSGCRYNPKNRTGDDACPFSTFYWDFMLRNEETLRGNHRMGVVMKNVDRMAEVEKKSIRKGANKLRRSFGIE